MITKTLAEWEVGVLLAAGEYIEFDVNLCRYVNPENRRKELYETFLRTLRERPVLHLPEGFTSEDLLAVADGLETEPKTVAVGTVELLPGEHHEETRESSTAYAARFIRACAKHDTENPWKQAVIEKHVVNHTLKAEHETNPELAINDLLSYETQVQLDPAVSSAAAQLIADGKSHGYSRGLTKASSICGAYGSTFGYAKSAAMAIQSRLHAEISDENQRKPEDKQALA